MFLLKKMVLVSKNIMQYFKKMVSSDNVQHAELLHAAIKNVTSAGLQFAEEKLQKSNKASGECTRNLSF